MWYEIKKTITLHPLEAIGFFGSMCAAIISFVVYIAVWQSTITNRVTADESNISDQSMVLQKVNDTLNTINTRGEVTSQKVNDINDKVNLIYEAIKH